MLGDNLRRLRKKKKLTQQQIADLLKINRVTYTQYELNKREPDNSTLDMLADFFKVSVDHLLGRVQQVNGRALRFEDNKILDENDIEKIELVKDLSVEELKSLVELSKTIKSQQNKKQGD